MNRKIVLIASLVAGLLAALLTSVYISGKEEYLLRLKKKLAELPHVKEVRGQGLLVGCEFDDTISGVDVKHGCFDRHLLITAIGKHIIRLIPPLIITEADCDKAVAIIKETVESLSK